MATVIDMSKLSDLEPLSKRLNASSDELTKTLETIQTKINGYALGVEAWLDEDDVLDYAVTGVGAGVRTIKAQELGYGRIGDGWALLVRLSEYTQELNVGSDWVFGEPPVEIDRKPLLKASRQIRVKAVDLIPRLIDRLFAAATTVVDAVEKAKKIADSLE